MSTWKIWRKEAYILKRKLKIKLFFQQKGKKKPMTIVVKRFYDIIKSSKMFGAKLKPNYIG